MRDPYDVLGVPKSATDHDIKRAFRRLAKKYHPDYNKNDPRAQEKFAEINSAYEILGETQKRTAFDRGEIDAEGKPRLHGFSGDPRYAGAGSFEDLFKHGRTGFSTSTGGRHGSGGSSPGAGDIFSDLFASAFHGEPRTRESTRRKANSGEDASMAVLVTLEDLMRGTKTITLPTGRTLDVTLPKGTEEGKQIRLRHQGHAALFGGEAGDVLLTIKIAKHPYFKIEGQDLRLDFPLTLYEAILGGSVEIPTLQGRRVAVNVPAQTTGEKTLRLRNLGLPTESGFGDLLVTLRIVLPPESGEELEKLMRQWQKTKPYNPRTFLER